MNNFGHALVLIGVLLLLAQVAISFPFAAFGGAFVILGAGIVQHVTTKRGRKEPCRKEP